ncbi:MAG: hypothetical protein K8F92_18490 [Hyphomicrobium sp.]|uniref:bestrophin-like domain n=1 Tax=Hyphomicrobium sp. TaxID=82 RepID=UPI0013273EDE|nr:hypothetical protein [Hyphomicrobium sp.]KAB2941822.1 MAG: hypothetical protein F9K20_08750 [Hyphomicrobium sp.]MBZ0211618.1 hypothetical protein [Hyphomicrobium sp.]
MSALQISTMIFALVIAASIAGVLLAPSLSAKYLSANDSREFFKAVRNVIIGLVSFSLGLLVTSSKTDFQKHRDELKGQATNIIVLDRVLRDYGPEANPARAELRRTVLNEIHQIQLAANDLVADAKAIGASHMGKLRLSLIQLSPKNEGQSLLKATALGIGQQIVTSRWRIYEDLSSNIIWPVVGALVFWLMAAFFAIGVIAPRHALALGGLLVASLSVAVAMYLIVELGAPYEGQITISPQPLEEAVAQISEVPG